MWHFYDFCRMRTIVIGDIHSGYLALKQLLERIGVEKEDKLIFLGDYVDGWSSAVETVDYLLDLSAKIDCVFLRGNHDELVYDWLKDGLDKPMWLAHGGEASKNSYTGQSDKLIEAHKVFYESLQNYHLDDKNRLFVHAGFTNLNGVKFEYFSKMFYWDRTLWEMVLGLDTTIGPDHALYPKRLKNYLEIYIGHTPVTRINKTKPVLAANVWNMDTGAAFKGPLSAMDVDSKTIWQSDPVYQLYPKERGRN